MLCATSIVLKNLLYLRNLYYEKNFNNFELNENIRKKGNWTYNFKKLIKNKVFTHYATNTNKRKRNTL